MSSPACSSPQWTRLRPFLYLTASATLHPLCGPMGWQRLLHIPSYHVSLTPLWVVGTHLGALSPPSLHHSPNNLSFWGLQTESFMVEGFFVYLIDCFVFHSSTLLFIHSICKSLHLLIPNFQSIPPPPPSPLATTSLLSLSMSLFYR